MSGLVSLVLALGVVGPLTAQDTTSVEPDVRAMELGQQYLAWFLEGDLGSFRGAFDEAMTEGMSMDQLVAFHASGLAAHGREPTEAEETVVPYEGLHVYMHTARWPISGQVRRVQLAIDAEGRIAGFFIVPVG